MSDPMTSILLIGGPLDGMHVELKLIRGNEIRVMARPYYKQSLAHCDLAEVSTPRECVYEIRDNESGTAHWLGFADEIPVVETPLMRAMANATDDEILKLMDDITDAERKQ